MYKPKSWDILLVRWVSRLSKAIRWFTKWMYNHAWVFVEIWGELFIIEAEKNWIRSKFRREEYSKREWREFAIIESPDVEDKKVWMLCVPFVGVQKYDFASLLIYQPLYQLTGKWLGRKNNGENRFYCSEFAAYVRNKLFGIFDKWYSMSPQDLYLEWQKHAKIYWYDKVTWWFWG